MEKKNHVEDIESSASSLKPEPLFPLKGYVILNLIFWAYCLLQLVVLTWIFKDVVGLIFFFIVLGVGFTLVSIFDCIYDRIAYKNKSIKTGEHQTG